MKQQSRSIQNHDRTARDREFGVGQPVFSRQYLGPREWVGGLISRRIGPLSYDVQVGDQISLKHSSKLLPNRAHNQDLSDRQLDHLYNDASYQPVPERNIQPEPERNIQTENERNNDAPPLQVSSAKLPICLKFYRLKYFHRRLSFRMQQRRSPSSRLNERCEIDKR